MPLPLPLIAMIYILGTFVTTLLSMLFADKPDIGILGIIVFWLVFIPVILTILFLK